VTAFLVCLSVLIPFAAGYVIGGLITSVFINKGKNDG